METNPKVYVGTYEKYTNGDLSGEWLTLSDYSDEDEFLDACKNLHSDEDDPEFMFQSFEGETFKMATEDSIEPDLFEILSELNEDELKIFAAYRSNFDGSWRECQDAYVGQYKSHKDFAYEWAESCGYIQQDVKWPYTCIDWNEAALDLMGDFFEDNGFYFYSR